MSAMLASHPATLARVLFAEDFDNLDGVTVIEAPPEPEVIAPVFTVADVESIRERAYADGRAAAIAATEAAHTEAARTALADISAAFDAVVGHQAALVEREAEEVARLLLDTLMTLLPALCVRHGEAEVRAVARAVLPALVREPAVTVRINPELAVAIGDEIRRLDPDLVARIRLVPVEALVPGDIRISWAEGNAVRDTGAVWKQVADALSAAGLLLHAEAEKEHAGGG